MAKHRVFEFAKVWAALYEFKSRSDKLIREAANAIDSSTLERESERLRHLETRSSESADRLKDLADQSQFWLGDLVYSDVREVNNLLMDRMSAFADADRKGVMSITQSIEERLPTIDKYLTAR